MDNKGHHFLWHVNSGINVPGIAVATVTRNYVKREDDELELRVRKHVHTGRRSERYYVVVAGGVVPYI